MVAHPTHSLQRGSGGCDDSGNSDDWMFCSTCKASWGDDPLKTWKPELLDEPCSGKAPTAMQKLSYILDDGEST